MRDQLNEVMGVAVGKAMTRRLCSENGMVHQDYKTHIESSRILRKSGLSKTITYPQNANGGNIHEIIFPSVNLLLEYL